MPPAEGNPLNQLVPVVLIRPSLDPADIFRGFHAGAADVWGTCTSLGEGLSRVQALLRFRNYVDEQAKLVVLSLARSIEAKDSLADGHSGRMVEYAVELAESHGLQEQELQELRIGCLLHDVGKVAIPDSILLKPGPLDPQEMEIVRQHPVVGENICASLRSFRGVLPIIRHHHERMDGSGYPDGLRGEQIPLAVRVLQVADIYDALTTNRPYRVALSSEEALHVLRQEAARGWLDASLVSKFSAIRRSAENLRESGKTMLASYYGMPEPVAFSSTILKYGT